MNLKEMALKLEADADYRVLRRLPMAAHFPSDAYTNLFNGIYIDVETTGLNVERDEIIEFAAIPFKFENGGLIMGPEAPLHFYNEPRKSISAEITALTGVNSNMVAGMKLDVDLLEQVLAETHLVVAHNSAFDRQMVERYLPTAAKKCWGCSFEEVPWPKRGKRLEYIVSDMGYFYDAHNAINDCRAGLFALSQIVGGKPAFSYVLDAARATTYRVWALEAPFAVKDLLKARGYYWNPGEDRRAKAWHRIVPEGAQQEETAWLQQFVYGKKQCTARFDKVTAFDRYSRRV